MEATTTDTERVPTHEASFFPSEIAAVLRGEDSISVTTLAAAALVNEFTELRVTPNDGERANYAVMFKQDGVIVRPGAARECTKDELEESDDLYYDLYARGDVLAINKDKIEGAGNG